jgi:adenylate cyclase
VGKKIGAPDGWIVVERDGAKAIASATTHRDPWLRSAFEKTCCQVETVRNAKFDLDGDSYLCAATAFPEDSGLDWLVVLAIPESDILGTLHRNSIFAAVAAIVIAAFFLVFGFLQARRRLTRPLENIARDLEEMSRLETEKDPRVQASRITEVEGMVRAREAMRGGLRSFKKYVPVDLVRELMESGQEARLGGERRVLSVMFSDVIGFTRISEELGDPQALVSALGEYLDVMSAIIARYDGTVDKYVGDAILAFWGAPKPHPSHELAACKAAWDSQVMLRILRDRWSATGHPLFHARIGVNTGEMVVGNIGSAARMNYTVMGDAANLGSRLEGLCTVYGLEIAIGEATAEAVRDAFEVRPVDCVEVKGREQATVFYELLGPCGSVSEERMAFAKSYEKAFDLYMRRAFGEARAAFEAALELEPADVAARELATRCATYEREPPPDDWTGAVRLTRKK